MGQEHDFPKASCVIQRLGGWRNNGWRKSRIGGDEPHRNLLAAKDLYTTMRATLDSNTWFRLVNQDGHTVACSVLIVHTWRSLSIYFAVTPACPYLTQCLKCLSANAYLPEVIPGGGEICGQGRVSRVLLHPIAANHLRLHHPADLPALDGFRLKLGAAGSTERLREGQLYSRTERLEQSRFL